MNNLRKVNKILFLTLIVFSLGVFANYSETSSKYLIGYTSDKIVDSINFMDTLFKDSIVKTGSEMDVTNKKVAFNISFYRTLVSGNDIINNRITDTYQVVSPTNGCTIERITGVSSDKVKIASNKKSATITYGDVISNMDDAHRVTIRYSCNITDDILVTENNKKYVKMQYKVYEKVNTEEKFVYFTNFSKSGEYKEPVGYEITDDNKTLIVYDNEKLKEGRDAWLMGYANSYTSLTSSETIGVLSSYIPFDTLKNNPSSILGLEYTTTPTAKKYTITNQMLSYAYTKYDASSNDYFGDLYYIDVTDEQLIKNMFKYYLDNVDYYSSKYTADERKNICDYVDKHLYKLVVNDVPLLGLDKNGYKIKIKNNILDIINFVNPSELDISNYNTLKGRTDLVKLLDLRFKSFANLDLETGLDYNYVSLNSDYLLKNKYVRSGFLTDEYFYFMVDDVESGTKKIISMYLYKDASSTDANKRNVLFETFDAGAFNPKSNIFNFGFTEEKANFDDQTKLDNCINDYYENLQILLTSIDAKYGTAIKTSISTDIIKQFITDTTITENPRTKIISDKLELVYNVGTSNNTIDVRITPTVTVSGTTTSQTVNKKPIENVTSSTSTQITSNTSTSSNTTTKTTSSTTKSSSLTTTTVPTTLTTTVKTTAREYTDVSLNDNKVGSNN